MDERTPAAAIADHFQAIGPDETRAAELILRFDGGDPHPVVAIPELRDGFVILERIYIAEPWAAPVYRAEWAEVSGPFADSSSSRP